MGDRRLDALQVPAAWPVPSVAAGVARAGEVIGTTGDPDRRWRLASVTKLVTALAALVAVEEGTIAVDEPAGPPGATLRHLLAHTAGYPFEGDTPIARPGARRIYSNTGFEVAAALLEERSGIAFADYAREAVLEPLGMSATAFDDGSAAAGAHASLADVLRLGRELLAPTLVDPTTLATATSVQFPGLAGIVPGIGRMDPCDWGLGFEIRDGKAPHWTPTTGSPATFGHFGGAGTFLWVDPDAGLACAALTDREFGPWALEAWPPFGDAVLAEVARD
jgi:CubicO group peptidase (beta-lactamase class C family)